MILLEGAPPKESMIVVSLIQPDGSIRHVSFLAERLNLEPVPEVFGPIVEELLHPNGRRC